MFFWPILFLNGLLLSANSAILPSRTQVPVPISSNKLGLLFIFNRLK